jgi:hypothetical protein
MRAAAALLLLGACLREAADPLEVHLVSEAGRPAIRLVPAPGWRINALLPPALELPDGAVVRLHADHLSADSAYYTAPPTGTLPAGVGVSRGTLRASVCAVGEQVCRPYVRRLGG